MIRPTLLLCAIACFHTILGESAAAQQTIFHEDFEAGLDQWENTGIWNLEAEVDNCGSLVAPFPNPGSAAWYGLESSCDFSGEYLPRRLTTKNAISIPSWADQVTLRLWSYEQTECFGTCEWDWRLVFASSDGGLTWSYVGEGYSENAWYELVLDLTPFAGQDVLLRFEFNPVDDWGNFFLGWFVDDVRVEIYGCAPTTNFCQTAGNSVGSGAIMSGRGIPSISANYFKVAADFAPPGQFGLFYYGPNEIQLPFGDGFRCVGGGGDGTFRLNPPAVIDGSGFAHRLLDFTQPPEGSGPGKIEVGSTWKFQFWYRDPAAGGSGFNLSDGLSVTFCP